MIPEYVAHTPPDTEPEKWQSMQDHTANVARLAAQFAAPFGAQELAQWAAWLHDVGKYSNEFQKYLVDCAAGISRKPGSAEHKCAGTKMALETSALPTAVRKLLAACVLGHHGALPYATEDTLDNAVALVEEDTPGGEKMLQTAIQRARDQCSELQSVFPKLADISATAALPTDPRLDWEMLTRFVFSCLVDADCLDTEQHFSDEKSLGRRVDQLDVVLDHWRQALEAQQEDFRRKPKGSAAVNEVRREVYGNCVKAASHPPGLFTLTVPTGGGKTLSSLAFALEHAAAHRHSLTLCRSRIIYAAPYTSIIDQTADTFRGVLGPNAVLEHHSAIEARKHNPDENSVDAQEEDSSEVRRRLMAENWEVPLVVTTTVQLLESLFADRTTRCRKLHNLAGSIIILDEVQTLPPNLLRPLLSGLRALQTQFGVTLVLCTATQPAITGKTPFRESLGEAKEINPAPEHHFQKLKRVTYHVEEKSWDWAQTAEKIAEKKHEGRNVSCLAVLNTKKDALALLDALRGVVEPGTELRHLSTLMCGSHRRQVLDEVKELLERARNGGPAVILVSTQVIEAGVNIDFPRGFRAMGPLDRIIQTAGRVNREGGSLASESDVTVFTPLDGSAPPGVYRTGIETALAVIRRGGAGFDFDTPIVATDYFHELYTSLGDDRLDKEKVQPLRQKHDFPTVARKVRLVKEDTIPVLVPYHQDKHSKAKLTKAEFDALVDQIRDIVAAQQAGHRKGKTLPRDLWQKIQPLTVAVYTTEQAKLPLSKLVPDQLWLWGGTYDTGVGIGNSVDWDICDNIA